MNDFDAMPGLPLGERAEARTGLSGLLDRLAEQEAASDVAPPLLDGLGTESLGRLLTMLQERQATLRQRVDEVTQRLEAAAAALEIAVVRGAVVWDLLDDSTAAGQNAT